MENQSEEQSIRGIINRLQRIEGQVRGVQKMVQDGRDGGEILTQISAVLGASRRVARTITAYHMQKYVCDGGVTDPQAAAKLQALIDAFTKLD